MNEMEVKGDPRGLPPRPKNGKAQWHAQLTRKRQSGPQLNSSNYRDMGPSTRSIHSGTVIDEKSGAVGTPIYQSSTFTLSDEQYESVDQGYARDRFIYSRYGNPSQWSVQTKLAELEGAESAIVFSSGMAAIATSLVALMDPGGHVVTSQDLYGGTYNFFNCELPNMGMSSSFVDPRNLKAIESAIQKNTQVLYFEVLTNPLLKVLDIEGVVALAKKHNLRVVLDMTFATPIGCQALDYGVDLVVHSASKYLNGHSDLIAGVCLGSRKLTDKVWGHMLNFGGCLDPHSCFLLERGLKTLSVRMKTHEENATAVAQFLKSHEEVFDLHYPGLESHPDYQLAKEQFQNSGGMVSFSLKKGDQAALQLCKSLRLFIEATSLGGVESLISLPFNTSHATMTQQQRRDMGINDGAVRLSVGIEDKEDLIEDLKQALEMLSKEPDNA